MELLYKAYGRKDDHTSFRYDKAPPRGWQEGKRDFTEKVTYYRWHVFNKKDDYSLV
jgi:small subunit ribosomal protein S17